MKAVIHSLKVRRGLVSGKGSQSETGCTLAGSILPLQILSTYLHRGWD